MAPRDTSTVLVLEQMILPSLGHGGCAYQTQVNIGSRFGSGRHIVDVVAEDSEGNKILISLKWQQVSGTAEQKVPFEAMCLLHSRQLITRTPLKTCLNRAQKPQRKSKNTT